MQAQAAAGQRGQPAGTVNDGLKRSISFLGRQKRLMIVAYTALVIAALAQLMVPQLTQAMIDAITNGTVANNILDMEVAGFPAPAFLKEAAAQQAGYTIAELEQYQQDSLMLLTNAAIAIVLFAIVRGIFSFVQAFYSEKMSQGIAFDMRNDLFTKLGKLSFSYYDRNQTGQLMVRATDDVEKVRLFLAQGLVLAIQALVLLLATLLILFLTNWKLTLVILPILPAAVILFMIFGKISQPLFVEIQIRLSRLNSILQENLAGIKVVKAFTREPHERQRFEKSALSLYEQQVKVARTFSFLFPLVFFIAQFGQALLLYFGGREIIYGSITLGEYQEFSLYLIYLFFPLAQLGFIISLMAQASASSNRVFEIYDAKSDVSSKPDALTLSKIQGNVEFRDVTFRYFGSSEAVLRNVSFVAKPGQTVALLGSTGSGKTTIINLLPRFYDASEGAVLIDGTDVRDVSLDSLRSQIGIVLQETNLFSGSIRDNIAFGRPEATDEEVIAAAKAAAAHDFILSFPDNYNTPVGERGTTLSGGQKQRIAIARALLLDPRLLILDDSTSSVDMITEAKIQHALDRLMKGRTSFVIAQRISTVVNADQILVLDKGRVVATGTHEELMEDSPIYAEIYNSQLVGDVVVEEAVEALAEMDAVALPEGGHAL